MSPSDEMFTSESFEELFFSTVSFSVSKKETLAKSLAFREVCRVETYLNETIGELLNYL